MEGGGRKNFGRRGGGASGGRAGGRGGNYQGHGGGRGRGRAPQGSQYQTPVQAYQGGAGGSQINPSPAPRAWGNRPQQPDQGQGSGTGVQRPAQQPLQVGVGPTPRGTWTGRPWGPSTSASSLAKPQTQLQPQSPPQSSAVDIQSLKISESQHISSPSESTENRTMPIKRPDRGGSLAIRTIPLLVNHFPVNFNPNATIIHYDVDVKPVASPGDRFVRKSVSKSDLRLIRDKLFSSGDSRFPLLKTAYDGEKNIFSAVTLPTGEFKVELSDGEDSKIRSYLFTIKFVNELKLSKLKDYLRGNLSYIPRDILQGMDLVMKDNPSRNRISVGRSFYSPNYRAGDDLHHGLAAYRGFQQSLRPTSQGLTLCLDYSVLAFRKPLPVLEFLKEHVQGFNGVNDVTKLRQKVIGALKGLKVRVTHRVTKQKYTVSGLTTKNARGISFTFDDPDGINPPTEINLVGYFMDKWGKNIVYKDIPCLDLSKNNRPNYVPMEFCVLVEGQRYPKEQLDRDAGVFLKKLSLAPSHERKDTIYEMVHANDGPCGDVMKNFEIGVDKNMTRVAGRVIGAPDLKLGSPSVVKVDKDKCQWNLVGKSLVEGKSIERWALIDFTYGDRFPLHVDPFINNLRSRCRNLGMSMDEPLWYHSADMREFSSISRIEGLLSSVVKEAMRIKSGKLQLIVCVMTRKDPGYKYLKFVSETKIGVITQCCLSMPSNKGQDQYFANLCIKINAKLGGSNVELSGRLPHFEGKEHVMFIGADVNHPGSKDSSCPSIAAVVGTVNWPAANRYAARVCPQDNRKEKILNYGAMCSDLVNTYARINRVRPSKIVVFRDGVSEGQFDMVLNEELIDLRRAIYNSDYKPTITLVVAIKRHQTRLFLQNARDGGASGNVPPGTVVDTTIVHPFEFDFYLCSHYGGLGTSKPTHYYVLWDENYFTSDSLQKLIHHMCFTFARCTKPVSLVPPVYYADLVAYRGRLFQEVAMELQSRESSSSSSSSAAAASFDQSFYTLHPELQNIMFFV
ncbi:argonaute 2 [Olea europaea subsp. europaea]|uniref:Argonaute 2 n=1 Tax=Olea europaea subsp. europaea TaxID=158383 RepID=A0A8S0P9N7_OLEEU|nr:argonaute 2 [Olea europaea subsp. europaea]